jgi:hypothetical protein
MRTTIINLWELSYRNTARDTVPIAASRVCLLRLLLDVSAADSTYGKRRVSFSRPLPNPATSFSSRIRPSQHKLARRAVDTTVPRGVATCVSRARVDGEDGNLQHPGTEVRASPHGAN